MGHGYPERWAGIRIETSGGLQVEPNFLAPEGSRLLLGGSLDGPMLWLAQALSQFLGSFNGGPLLLFGDSFFGGSLASRGRVNAFAACEVPGCVSQPPCHGAAAICGAGPGDRAERDRRAAALVAWGSCGTQKDTPMSPFLGWIPLASLVEHHLLHATVGKISFL